MNVTIATGTHPVCPELREQVYGVVAVGTPCRVLRKIDDRDYEYYYKDCKIGFEVKRNM